MMWLALTILCASLSNVFGVFCPGLGDFPLDEPPFEGWPEPTCPGDPSQELSYTMYNSANLLGETFDRNSVPSIFNPSQDTLFIAHGWNSNFFSGWMHDMKDAVLNFEDMNAVIVGWGGQGGSENLNYWESASNTRTVGAETAEVMANLINVGGGQASRMRCVGHSLGAHMCGHFGRWAGGNNQLPGRITGMDPAGPNFALNTDRTVGIWIDCGGFVDIIHTDRTLGSTPEPGSFELTLGHQDFFPNSGNAQPGCGSDGCSHSRVHALFIASITNGCFDATMQCTASNDLPDASGDGSCSACTVCPRMGYHATPGVEGIFYLATSGSGNYC